MKTCLLNLPYHTRIMRRYSCTYYAPNFLFPPLELMYLGAIIKEWKGDDCILIDAIAEGLSLDKIVVRLKVYQPNLLVFMAGIESFTEDMRMIMRIKSFFPLVKIACIGYLPSIFPRETMENNHAIDYIIMHEPEESFSELYDGIKKADLSDIPIKGVGKRHNGSIIIGEGRPRIKDLDMLPFPARHLIKNNLYSELLMPKLFTVIQTMRGCPFKCTFCVPTYGRETVFRSIDNVLAEIKEAVFKYGVTTIRFMDDTFTLDKNRIMRFCSLILEKAIQFDWSLLSRVGLLDREMLLLMKKSGLRRVYLGIETGSQRLLDYYKKGYKADLIMEQVRLIKENNIEAVGFFMVGGPQTEEEFRKDIALAKELNLDYIVVEKITPYPGTELFERMKEGMLFNLSPYLNIFKDNQLRAELLSREKLFYRSFYFNPRYFIKMLKYLFLNPKCLINGAKRLARFLFFCQLKREIRLELI